jgi:uncharacterized membrane protein
MNKHLRNPQLQTLLALTASLLLVAFIGPWSLSAATAQSGDDASTPRSTGYDLRWWSVDGGGYTFSTGGGYSLGGTVGQPDAGVLIDGGYVLGGGFWRGGTPIARYTIYLPVIVRDF